MNAQTTRWAPIGLFIHRRPEHTRRTIMSLHACEGMQASPIYVFADGPRTEADVPAVEATRSVARELLGGRAVFVEQQQNRGLADSVIAGTTELCDRFGQCIIVEDDLVVVPAFLRFLNEGLTRYRDEPRVMQISGHVFDVPTFAQRREALLLPMTTSWGWATWKRAWDLFDPAATGWRELLSNAAEATRFDLGDRFDYVRMLERQMKGEIDSWAIRWYYAVFAHHGLALFPPRTLVVNIGFDGSGTHDRLALRAHQAPLGDGASFELPADVSESREKEQVFEAVGAFRHTSARRKALGYARFALRRFGLR